MKRKLLIAYTIFISCFTLLNLITNNKTETERVYYLLYPLILCLLFYYYYKNYNNVEYEKNLGYSVLLLGYFLITGLSACLGQETLLIRSSIKGLYAEPIILLSTLLLGLIVYTTNFIVRKYRDRIYALKLLPTYINFIVTIALLTIIYMIGFNMYLF